MELKLVLSLLVLGLLSTALAKGGAGHRRKGDHPHRGKGKKCPALVTLPELNLACTVSDDCSSYTCSAYVGGQDAQLSLKISAFHQPMSAEVNLKVPSQGFDWSHTFTNGEKIQVPGFPVDLIQEYVDADMSLMVKMYKKDEDINFELDVLLDSSLSSKEVSLTLMKGKLPLSSPEHDTDKHDTDKHGGWKKCHKFAHWFKRQSSAVKASIILSGIFVFAILMFSIVYCCKKRRGGKNVKVMLPSYEQVTSTNTKVPLEPLVNEE